LIKKAHHDLRLVRAANAGDIDRMLRICYLATGRLGKRRRQLASAYLTKGPPVDSAALENSISSLAEARNAVEEKTSLPSSMQQLEAASGKAGGHIVKRKGKYPPQNSTWLENWDLEKVKALANAQFCFQSHSYSWPKDMNRSVDPKKMLSAENCWGLPLKPKLVTNKTKTHFAKVFSNLMPPLPQGEWDVLKALALGEAEESMWSIPPRRPVAVGSDEAQTAAACSAALGDKQWSWEKYATQSVRCLEKGNARKRSKYSASFDEVIQGHGRPIGVRVFKPRSLRRYIYGRVWEASPVVKTTSGGKLAVTWGNQDIKVSGPSASDLPFFEGVNQKGVVVSSNNRATAAG
jgi:hypothetical protein